MTPEIQTTITIAPWMIRATIVAVPVTIYVIICVLFYRHRDKDHPLPKTAIAFFSIPLTMLSILAIFVTYIVGIWVVYG